MFVWGGGAYRSGNCILRRHGPGESQVVGQSAPGGSACRRRIDHVDDAAIRVLLAAKGVERTVLVSDGTAATGMPDGRYRLGSFEVNVKGGVCRNAEGKLAGSTLTLDRAVRHMVRLGVGLPDAVRMATFNPARVLGVEARKGILAAGADADLVLLDAQLQVAGVMARGVGWPTA